MADLHPIPEQMYSKDKFSQWLAIERISEKPGYSKLKMVVREDMVNGFGIAHGGITFSLADSAFAFASNSRGLHAVSIDCTVNHILPVHVNDELTAETEEISTSNKLAIYMVKVKNQNDQIVALFKGMVYRTRKEW